LNRFLLVSQELRGAFMLICTRIDIDMLTDHQGFRFAGRQAGHGDAGRARLLLRAPAPGGLALHRVARAPQVRSERQDISLG